MVLLGRGHFSFLRKCISQFLISHFSVLLILWVLRLCFEGELTPSQAVTRLTLPYPRMVLTCNCSSSPSVTFVKPAPFAGVTIFLSTARLKMSSGLGETDEHSTDAARAWMAARGGSTWSDMASPKWVFPWHENFRFPSTNWQLWGSRYDIC